MWKHLKHPNVVPLLGITSAPLQVISEWMSGGNLPGYIKENPDVDRLRLVGFLLLHLSHTYGDPVTSSPTSLRVFATFTPIT